MTLRYLTAGESHGPALTGILEGMPAGVEILPEDFAAVMHRRQAGYGRGRRSQIEPDHVEVLSGLIGGFTIGSPVALLINNVDFSSHSHYMHPFNTPSKVGEINVPLPGHADLAGVMKYGFSDCRPVRERASARETAMRTALSVPARKLLSNLGIGFTCFVESLGGIRSAINYETEPEMLAASVENNGHEFLTPDAAIIKTWKDLIDKNAEQNRSLGGTGAIVFYGLPVGLGSHVHYDRRLDAILTGLIMSIPAIKGCEVGNAVELAADQTSAVDSIVYNKAAGFVRGSNRSGGLEGGMTTGQPLIIRFHMKPLPANADSDSVNLQTLESARPAFYRSDVQAVTAAAVVAESLVALQLASEIITITGGDSLSVIKKRMSTL